ncbi:hypothetical protein K435DRAFT_833489 [Dendrothele bispora CBS 962.96]|uniref:Uncharacterized protein n=1 Tax=Dendrothele bispora (strain CBS 962.96) TaxID=1314807 RepID=A0A4S8MYN2_DENBC|nr:hypothetical protein K435DRAFT_833489 [Dendrothele bispora CBS 962.96]
MSGANASDSDSVPSKTKRYSHSVANTTASSPRSRIHFPAEPRMPSRILRPADAIPSLDGTTVASLGRQIPHSIDNISKSSRRRVVSVDSRNTYSNPARAKRVTSFTSSKLSNVDPETGEWGLNAFSDEYDLSQEDTKILQDINRAVKLKARRDARLKAGLPSPLIAKRVDPSSASSHSSTPLYPITASPPATFGPNANSSDIDFSPSTGATPTIAKLPLHPVPTSHDDGHTLDWSNHSWEDEKDKRWSLSTSKRKGKEKEVSVDPSEILKQEAVHDAKLGQLSITVSQHTLRKADITRNQLGRRYNLIYGQQSSGSKDFNLLKAAKWYGEQGNLVKASLESAEPFTWLKHFEKQNSHVQDRIPWHLSALVMEEFLTATSSSPNSVLRIDESSRAQGSSPDLSPSPSIHNSGIPPSSRTSSRFSLGPSLTKHISAEGRISFEPHLEPVRTSLESRRSVESVFSSLVSASSAQNRAAANALPSPASSRIHLRDGIRKRLPHDSDDASSTRNSVVIDPSDDNGERIASSDAPVDLLQHPSRSQPGTATSSRKATEHSSPLDDIPSVTIHDVGSSEVLVNPSHAKGRNTLHISIPSEDRIDLELELERRREAEEAELEQEYHRKLQQVIVLENAYGQNMAARHMLNRIAIGVREYEKGQSKLMSIAGLSYEGLSRDLMEAFSHDPAIILGHTKRSTGYQAVEDIHFRLQRQREILQEFVRNGGNNNGTTLPKDIFEDPLSRLKQSLEALEGELGVISERAKEVTEVLKSTQSIHASVKAEYNETLAHTSVIYPELSNIVALEENYRDQYQRFWEIGMDMLTLVLDRITPFWRTYGKTIGYDVQDFLIIPLYRNEFTGEAKHYPITRLPSRSFRHWVLLILFFFGCGTLLYFQASTAWFSSLHFGSSVEWVDPPALRFLAFPIWGFIVFVQWITVLVEFSVVLLQIGTVFWWIGWYIGLLH